MLFQILRPPSSRYPIYHAHTSKQQQGEYHSKILNDFIHNPIILNIKHIPALSRAPPTFL